MGYSVALSYLRRKNILASHVNVGVARYRASFDTQSTFRLIPESKYVTFRKSLEKTYKQCPKSRIAGIIYVEALRMELREKEREYASVFRQEAQRASRDQEG